MAVEVNGTLRQNLVVLNALGLNSCVIYSTWLKHKRSCAHHELLYFVRINLVFRHNMIDRKDGCKKLIAVMKIYFSEIVLPSLLT